MYDLERARFNMIEQQIRPWEVLDPTVLDLLAAVRREDFVPPEHQALAFVDAQVPLGGGRFMLEPRVEARLLQELQLQRHEKVLEIGTGTGFMAALLGHRAQRVITLEPDAALAVAAAHRLQRVGLANVTVRHLAAKEAAHGLPAEAPFDAIVLSGSVHEVPRALLEQLKGGGRLAAIVGDEPVMRACVFTRATVGADGWSRAELFDTLAPRLPGFEPKPRFVF
ncbi:MAG: protein-L-isoaspartate O-methyltransferase [Rubrivivax sp.]